MARAKGTAMAGKGSKAKRLAPNAPAPHRFRAVGGQWLVTSDVGAHAFLTADEFNAWQGGKLLPAAPAFARLEAAGLVGAGYDEDVAAARLCRRKDYLAAGPYLHIFVVSLRCNQQCIYCHASRASIAGCAGRMRSRRPAAD